MHKACLKALELSLQQMAPQGGIAYLLYQVRPDYWIPIAFCKKPPAPYYRLGYCLKVAGPNDHSLHLIDGTVSNLIKRTKIEILMMPSASEYYQEVIPVYTENPTLISLAIIRSAPERFSKLQDDARAINPLIEQLHKTWGQFSPISPTDSDTNSGDPAEIAKQTAEIVSDKYSSPPYFLVTNFIVTVKDEGVRNEAVHINPLGYSYWLHMFSTIRPPWIGVMAERSNNYSEDLQNPEGLTDPQIKAYRDKIASSDVFTRWLAQHLRDDVELLGYATRGTSENETIKFWARHNRPKTIPPNSPYEDKSTTEFASPAHAIRTLLLEDQFSGDFLTTYWATVLNEHSHCCKTIHVCCDTSDCLQLDEADWLNQCPDVSFPQDKNENSPQIRVRFVPATPELIDITKKTLTPTIDLLYKRLVAGSYLRRLNAATADQNRATYLTQLGSTLAEHLKH